MPRGGHREGAGGKPTWIHGKTKTIRVPIALADQILGIARILDQGKSLDTVSGSKTLDLAGVSIHRHRDNLAVYLQDLLKAGYKIRPISLADRLRIDLDRNKLQNGQKSKDFPRS